MSVYANDPRVVDLRDGHFNLTHGAGREAFGRVFPMPDGGFGAKVNGHLDNPDVFPTTDEAIRSLIGEPQ